MNSIKVPHLPIEDFKASDLEERFSSFKDDGLGYFPDFIDAVTGNREKATKDIAIILHGLGMEQYIPNFQNKNVELETFLNLTDQDLEELEIKNPKHRDIILKGLKTHCSSHSPVKVPENHVEDLKIAKNVQNQVLLLQNYCAYVDLQLKKKKLVDYRISSTETAAFYFKYLTELALTQAQIMKDLLFDSKTNNHLIGKALKVNNLKLPKHVEQKLNKKKGKKGQAFLKVAVVVGFSSTLVLLGRLLVSQR